MLSKKFLKYFNTESNASKYFSSEIWKQIKPLFSDCCGMGRKLVGLKDADGNKIEIKGFPFTFDGETYATKELFEQAMAELYGAGYSAHLVDCCHLMFIWNRGLTEVLDNLQESPPVVVYNFDVENVDWSSQGVVNKSTFESWVLSSSNYTSLVVENFTYSNNRIQCTINASGGSVLAFSGKNISNINKIGGGFASLTDVFLNNNQILEFNPNESLPNSLTTFDLSYNQILEFNPSIALPSGLFNLYLDNNQIVNFNPNISLPNSLENLWLNNNQILSFSPSNLLPTSLMYINFANNQMDSIGYLLSEAWAIVQPAFTTNCIVNFSGNTGSISGTNLESTLITKNCTVLP